MNRNRENRYLLPLMGVLCAVSVIVMIIILVTFGSSKGSFAAPLFDGSAAEGVPDVPNSMGYSTLDVEQGYSAAVCGELSIVDGGVDVYFTSPATNKVWMQLLIIDENGETLGKTGVIKPNEYVKTLNLDSIPDKSISVKLKIIAFEPETYVSMGTVGLNTVLKVS